MKIAKMLAIMTLSLAFTGCRHKDFCYFHPHGNMYVEVEYDDAGDPDDTAYLRDKVRATRLRAYHGQTLAHMLATDMNRVTTELLLSPDSYHFIAHNAGTRDITFSDHESFYGHGVSTRECDILEPLYGSRGVESDVDLGNGEPVVIACEPIWAAGAENHMCDLGDTIRLEAQPLHCRYTYEMRNIDGLNGVLRLSAFITGMSHGATLGSGELYDYPVTVAVPAQVSADGKSVIGSFMCFGHNPRIGARHRMGLFLEMKSGAKYKFLEGDHFDVTDQVTSAPNRRRVHIVIDGIKIPTPAEDAGTGFDVTVNPWGDGENVDILYPIYNHK